jgi:hypothetical protein
VSPPAACSGVTLTLAFPDAGRYTVTSTTRPPATKARKGKKAAKAHTITYATSSSGTSKRSVSVTIHITPGRSAATALKTLHKLRVTISVKFTPTGGAPGTSTTTASVSGL